MSLDAFYNEGRLHVDGQLEQSKFGGTAMEKGFYEGGLVVDHLFINGFAGFGMGLFYRYSSYAYNNWQENLVFKIRISFTI